MELQQLRYFSESAECENFSKTASRNLVPPSAVSASIKKLERELGCKLFDRSANKLRLNKNGKIFAAAISEALMLIDSAKDALAEKENSFSGDINLLIRTERSFVTEKIVRFRELYPNVTFHLTHTFTKADHSDYDIIVDEMSDKYSGYERIPLVSEKIKIAASAKSALAGKDLMLKDLKNCEFLTMSKGSSLYGTAIKACAAAGFEPYITIESDDPLYIRRYISQNFGIAFFPEKSWQSEIEDGIIFLNVSDLDISRTTYAYIKKEKKSKLVMAFYNYLNA